MPTADDLAQLYRKVDFTILGVTGTGSKLRALECMACGIPCIFTETEPSATYSLAGASTVEVWAGVSKRGSVTKSLVACLEESYYLSAHDRAEWASRGVYTVRGQSTLRHTMMSLYGALVQLQTQNPTEFVKFLDRNRSETFRTLTQTESFEPVVTTGISRLGGFTARRIKTLGHLTFLFGSVWQEKGIIAAGRTAATELGQFASHRSKQIARFDSGAMNRVQITAEWAIRPFMRMRRAPRPRSSLLIGYIDAQLGLGQSLRGLALAMSRSAAEFSIYPFSVGVEERRGVAYMPERYDLAGSHAVNIIEVMPDELPTVFDHVSREHFDRSYNVLRTYWELAKAPEVWRQHLVTIDEIWAPNAFVADSFRPIFDRPITIVPPCVELQGPQQSGYRHFGLEKGRLYFLFSFDYFSFPGRKICSRSFAHSSPRSPICPRASASSSNPAGRLNTFRGSGRKCEPWPSMTIVFTSSTRHYHDRRCCR